MLVADARGFKVWGTVPASIDNVEKVDTVSLIANVEASADDVEFGFFKRPRVHLALGPDACSVYAYAPPEQPPVV